MLSNFDCQILIAPQITVSGTQLESGAYVGFARISITSGSQANLSISLGNNTIPTCSATGGAASNAVYGSTVVKAVTCGLDLKSSAIASQEIVISAGASVTVIFEIQGIIGSGPEVTTALQERFASMFGLQPDQVVVRIVPARRRLLAATVEVELLAEDQSQFSSVQSMAQAVTATDLTTVMQEATGDTTLVATAVQVEAVEGALAEVGGAQTPVVPVISTPEANDKSDIHMGAAIGSGVAAGVVLISIGVFISYRLFQTRSQQPAEDAKAEEGEPILSSMVYGPNAGAVNPKTFAFDPKLTPAPSAAASAPNQSLGTTRQSALAEPHFGAPVYTPDYGMYAASVVESLVHAPHAATPEQRTPSPRASEALARVGQHHIPPQPAPRRVIFPLHPMPNNGLPPKPTPVEPQMVNAAGHVAPGLQFSQIQPQTGGVVMRANPALPFIFGPIAGVPQPPGPGPYGSPQ